MIDTERSSSLCTELFDVNTLDLLGFECDDCIPATCQLNAINYDQSNKVIEILSIEILLSTDCTISVGDEIEVCLTLNTDDCRHGSIGYVQHNPDPDINAITDSSAILSNPFDVSSQCMIYTVFSDINSDIGVKNVESSFWYNKPSDNSELSQQCEAEHSCTFSVK